MVLWLLMSERRNKNGSTLYLRNCTNPTSQYFCLLLSLKQMRKWESEICARVKLQWQGCMTFFFFFPLSHSWKYLNKNINSWKFSFYMRGTQTWIVWLEDQSIKYSAIDYKLGTKLSWNTARNSQNLGEIFKIFEVSLHAVYVEYHANC